MSVTSDFADRHFLVQLPLFDGSVGDLVRLVSDGKLPVEDVPVAEITAQMRGYLDGTDALDLDVLGDALVATARIALLKSTRLLAQPATPEEAEGSTAPAREGWELRDRIASVAETLRSQEGNESLAPLVPPVAVERKFEPRRASLLTRAMEDMARRRARREAPVQVPAFVRLEAAVSSLVRRLRAGASVSLRRMLRGASRQDAVIHFLAVLEIVRRRQGAVEQAEPFADITIEYVDKSVETASRAG